MYVLRAALLCKQQEREMSILFHVIKTTTHRQSLCEPLYNYNTIHKKKEKTNCSILFHVIKTTTHRQSLCEPLYNYNTIHKKKEKTNCSILSMS